MPTFALPFLILSVSTLVGAVLCLHADGRDQVALAFLTPFIAGLREDASTFVWFLQSHRSDLFLALAAVSFSWLVVGAVRGQMRSDTMSIPASLLCISIGHYLFSKELLVTGIWTCLMGSLLVAFHHPAANSIYRDAENGGKPPLVGVDESFFLLILIFLTALLRFYALNKLPGWWDTEGAFAISASSYPLGVVLMTLAMVVPTASIGGLWFGIHYLLGQTLGTSIIASRIAATSLSLVALCLMYYFLRRLCGKTGAAIAVVLFAVDPLESIWARLSWFHGLPGFWVMLIAWSCWLASREPRLQRLTVMAALMAGSVFLYPSGMFGVIIPFGLALSFLFSDQPRRQKVQFFVAILVGATLWIVAKSLLYLFVFGRWQYVSALGPYLPIVSQRYPGPGITSFVPTFEDVVVIAQHLYLVAEQLFVRVPAQSHFGPLYGMLPPPNLIKDITSILLFIGLGRIFREWRNARSWLLVSWFCAALLPGLISIDVVERRLGPIFPALLAVAALGAELLLVAIGCHLRKSVFLIIRWTAVIVLWIVSEVVFISIFYSQPMATPVQEQVARIIRGRAKPGTLIVSCMPDGKVDGVFSLILDRLYDLKGQAGFRVIYGSNFSEPLSSLRPDLDSWYYTTTKLRDFVPDLRRRALFARQLVVMADHPYCASLIEAVYRESAYRSQKLTVTGDGLSWDLVIAESISPGVDGEKPSPGQLELIDSIEKPSPSQDLFPMKKH